MSSPAGISTVSLGSMIESVGWIESVSWIESVGIEVESMGVGRESDTDIRKIESWSCQNFDARPKSTPNDCDVAAATNKAGTSILLKNFFIRIVFSLQRYVKKIISSKFDYLCGLDLNYE